MGQKRFWNYKDDDSTNDMNHWLSGLIEKGVYRGFNFIASNDLNLVLNHTSDGYVDINKDLVASNPKGILVTTQGTIVKEDSNIVLPVETNLNLDNRIDLVIVTHEFKEIVGGSVAQYSVVKGTPSVNPVVPSLSNSAKQTIIGELYLPSGALTLDTIGVKFTKSNKPNFTGDDTIVHTNISNRFTKQNQENRTELGILNLTSNALTIGEDANHYAIYVNPDLSGETINYLESKPAGTCISIEVVNANTEDFDYINIVEEFNAVPAGFLPIEIRSGKFVHEVVSRRQTMYLRSTGSRWLLERISNLNRDRKCSTHNSSTGNIGNYSKVADIYVENQYQVSRLLAKVIDYGSDRHCDLDIHIKKTSAMGANTADSDVVMHMDNASGFGVRDLAATGRFSEDPSLLLIETEVSATRHTFSLYVRHTIDHSGTTLKVVDLGTTTGGIEKNIALFHQEAIGGNLASLPGGIRHYPLSGYSESFSGPYDPVIGDIIFSNIGVSSQSNILISKYREYSLIEVHLVVTNAIANDINNAVLKFSNSLFPPYITNEIATPNGGLLELIMFNGINGTMGLGVIILRDTSGKLSVSCNMNQNKLQITDSMEMKYQFTIRHI